MVDFVFTEPDLYKYLLHKMYENCSYVKVSIMLSKKFASRFV